MSTYCCGLTAADGTTDRFLHAHASDIKNHLKHVNDKALAETLQHGVGFYHEALSKQDKRIVEELFESGAIQEVSNCTLNKENQYDVLKCLT